MRIPPESRSATVVSEKPPKLVVLATWYEDGKNMDEIKVVYEENTDDVNLVTFPHIGVYAKTVEEVA